MRSSGILMSGEMVRAYLSKLKNQTRRTRGLALINEHPEAWKCDGFDGVNFVFSSVPSFSATFGIEIAQIKIKPPYGYIGDELWFKETWAPICRVVEDAACYEKDAEHVAENHYIEYRADTGNSYPGDWPAEEAKGNEDAPKWRSSMLMPKKYGRIVTKVTKVRVERLCSISDEDCMNEGITFNKDNVAFPYSFKDKKGERHEFAEVRSAYWNLVDSLNPKTLPAQNDHWVWVYEFPFYGGEVV